MVGNHSRRARTLSSRAFPRGGGLRTGYTLNLDRPNKHPTPTPLEVYAHSDPARTHKHAPVGLGFPRLRLNFRLALKHFCLHSSTRDGFERYRCQRQVTRVAYTFSVFNAFAKWVLSLLLLTTSVFAQVRILVPKQHYQQQEQISAKLENQTSQPITVCVQFGQWSPKGNTIESTPSPFFVERNDNGKWGVLLNGPHVGSNSQPVEVDSGKSMEFPFRLNGEGTMRLRLDYWIGFKPDMKCSGPSKGTKHLRSATFTLG